MSTYEVVTNVFSHVQLFFYHFLKCEKAHVDPLDENDY